jgi:proteasome lid subunit RPN8/RPN11
LVQAVSYVSIWKPVNDHIVKVSQESENEVVGLLMGRLENDTLIIEDSVTGDFQGERNHVTLPANTIAKIADDILNQRIKGSIVGWYHSHTESGLAFSDTDVQTQLTLQQFSSLVIAMVVDAQTGDVAYFRVDPQTERPSRIPDANISVFEQSPSTQGPEAATGQQEIPSVSTEVPETVVEQASWLSGRNVVIWVVLALGASLAVLGFIFYRGIAR